MRLNSKKAACAAFFDEYISEIIGEADSNLYALYSLISNLLKTKPQQAP
jgi:hypothetical protein